MLWDRGGRKILSHWWKELLSSENLVWLQPYVIQSFCHTYTRLHQSKLIMQINHYLMCYRWFVQQHSRQHCHFWAGKYLRILRMKPGESRILWRGRRIHCHRIHAPKADIFSGELISVVWRSICNSRRSPSPNWRVVTLASSHVIRAKIPEWRSEVASCHLEGSFPPAP